MRHLTLPVLAAMIFACAPVAFAQAPAPRNNYPAGPGLLFREGWLQPPGAKKLGEGDGTDDVVTRLTPTNLPLVVANKQLELHVYGKDGYLVRTAMHFGRNDLWTGMAGTPVAVTLKDKANYLDLTGSARVRWIVRTNSVSLLHPVVKLADGSYIVARHAIETGGDFLSVELAFNDMRWFKLNTEKVTPGPEVKNPDLTKVDEIGMANLAPSGGHGIAGSVNLSDVEVYAKPVPR
ncbi:MAG TPA: hypothetical protein VLV86_05525 [Vicinamibacterales bacterium]|nr:hypothetical protein [Vicinamibacterales bacterium]